MRFLLTLGALAALQFSLAPFALVTAQAEDAKQPKGVKIELTDADNIIRLPKYDDEGRVILAE